MYSDASALVASLAISWYMAAHLQQAHKECPATSQDLAHHNTTSLPLVATMHLAKWFAQSKRKKALFLLW